MPRPETRSQRWTYRIGVLCSVLLLALAFTLSAALLVAATALLVRVIEWAT